MGRCCHGHMVLVVAVGRLRFYWKRPRQYPGDIRGHHRSHGRASFAKELRLFGERILLAPHLTIEAGQHMWKKTMREVCRCQECWLPLLPQFPVWYKRFSRGTSDGQAVDWEAEKHLRMSSLLEQGDWNQVLQGEALSSWSWPLLGVGIRDRWWSSPGRSLPMMVDGGFTQGITALMRPCHCGVARPVSDEYYRVSGYGGWRTS